MHKDAATRTTKKNIFIGKTGIMLLIINCLVLAVVAAYSFGYRINRTNSLAKGVYRVIHKLPERGDIVSFWPPDNEVFREALRRGYIIRGDYNGYGPLLKKMLAISGDVVSIGGDGVRVNGVLIPNTIPWERDGTGTPLPVVRLDNYKLEEGEALFISNHLPRSFDSRYFGIQRTQQIIAVLEPVFVW